MSFWDSVSNALGTDGSHSGLNLQGFTDSVSNALGTDGSKNGLLNDPYSMAALALAGGAYLGYIPLGGSASAGGTVATSEAAASTAAAYATEAGIVDSALVPLTAMPSLGSSGVASVTAGETAAAFSLPSWLTPSNVLTGLSTASKFLGGSAPTQRNAAQPMYGNPGYFVNSQRTTTPQRLGAQAAAPGGGPDLTLIALAAAAFLLMK